MPLGSGAAGGRLPLFRRLHASPRYWGGPIFRPRRKFSAPPGVAEACSDLWVQQRVRDHALEETGRLVRRGFERSVGRWLFGVAGLTAGVICLGGYTRLTVSGLSMTGWKFQGSWLPFGEERWEQEFKKYKQTPEYKQVHNDIDMDGFKFIFFNEWLHRMLARGTGLAFVGGAAYYGLYRRAFTRAMVCRVAVLAGLFAAQGLIGWWMVKSGFEERTEEVKTPRVSPYRLVTHLLAGAALYLAFFVSGLQLALPASKVHLSLSSVRASARMRPVSLLLLPVGTVAFVSGAFVAGNDAGYYFCTWPKMDSEWVPADVRRFFAAAAGGSARLRAIFENAALVQFNHRLLAYATVVSAGWWFLLLRKQPVSPIVRRCGHLVAQTAGLQVILGIFTVLSAVPVSLGVAHQALGLGLLSAIALSSHTLRPPLWAARLLKNAPAKKAP